MAIKTVTAQLQALGTGTGDLSFEKIALSVLEDDPNTYQATVNAPNMSSFNLLENVFNVYIEATTTGGQSAHVDKNDPTFGNQCKLRVLEKIKPVIQFTFPSSDNAYITSTSTPVTGTITDVSLGGIKDSGISLSTLKATVKKNGSPVEVQEGDITVDDDDEDGIHSFSYMPTDGFTDGTWEVTINVSDNDGNAATAAVRTFTIDTIAPSIDINGPEYSNTNTVTITGTTDPDETITVIITVGEQQYTVNPDSSGAFSKEITLTEGSNVITAVARDMAGNTSPEPATITIIVDSSVPLFQQVTISPNPADAGASLIITVKVVSQAESG